MSRFIVSQIAGRLEEMFRDKLDLTDLNESKDKHFRDKMLSRALAAFAVQKVAGVSADEAARSVVDGGDDNGIDAILFNKQKKRLVIVQFKYIKDGSSEPSADELRAFRDGVNDLLDGKINKFNKKFRSRTDEITSVTQFGVRCDIVLIYTGKKELARHGTTILHEMMEHLNGTHEDAHLSCPLRSENAEDMGEEGVLT